MMTTTLRTAAAIAAAALLPAAAQAQLAPVPAANAVGGAYLSLARGHEALWINPANLALSGGPSVTLGLANFGTSFSALGLNLNQFAQIAQGNDDFDAGTKQQILDGIPASGTQIRGQLFVPAAALQIGRLAVGVGVGAVYDYNLGKDLVDLGLNGYDDTNLNYRVGNTNGRQATWVDVAAAYGQKLGPLSIGVTGHYLVPRALDNWRLFEPEYDLVNRSMRIQGYTAGTNAGSGYSVDVGATMNVLGIATVSAVVQNIAGNVTWNEQNLGYRGFVLTDQNVDDAATIISDAFSANPTPLTASSPLGAQQTVQGLFTQSFLPRTLRVGAHTKLQIFGTRISAQYNNQLQEGFLGGFWKSSVAVGASQKILFFTPSVGYAKQLSGNETTLSGIANAAQATSEGQLLTAGLGLGPLNISVAKLIDGKRDGAERQGVIIGAGLTLGF